MACGLPGPGGVVVSDVPVDVIRLVSVGSTSEDGEVLLCDVVSLPVGSPVEPVDGVWEFVVVFNVVAGGTVSVSADVFFVSLIVDASVISVGACVLLYVVDVLVDAVLVTPGSDEADQAMRRLTSMNLVVLMWANTTS